MANLQHTFGSDLTSSANGDILTSDGTREGQERVLRRLLTNPKVYIWHLNYGAGLPVNYGAGLPGFVGRVANSLGITAIAKAQMFLEAIVSRNPGPTISVDVAAAVQAQASALINFSIGSVLLAITEACASVGLWLQWLILQVLALTRLATSTGTNVDTWVVTSGFFVSLPWHQPAPRRSGAIRPQQPASSLSALKSKPQTEPASIRC